LFEAVIHVDFMSSRDTAAVANLLREFAQRSCLPRLIVASHALFQWLFEQHHGPSR
jgi:hypothetical protein